jgi:PKD repeat protein
MKLQLLLIAVFCYFISDANCLLSKVSIDERTHNSSLIINGKVKSKHSFWNEEKTCIYTASKIEIFNILKGNSTSFIEVITPGGEVDGKLIVVEPNANLNINDEGIFFLKENNIDIQSTSKLPKYEIYALAQGFIGHDKNTNTYSDPFQEYSNIFAVAQLISKTTGVDYVISDITNNRLIDNTYANSDDNIISLSPSRISAGTGSILTITGNGFGTKTGLANIQFRNANSTSFTNYTNLPDSNYIVSWTNNEIKVIVPGSSFMGQAGAGTGLVNIIHSNGSVITSNSPITITYNQFEYKNRRISLHNQNGIGGYTFTLNENFNNNQAAKATFIRAIDQWKCKTGVNVTLNENTTLNSCSNLNDHLNSISFSTSGCSLPAGTLGITYTSYILCSGSPVIFDGADIVFNANTNFYFGNGVTPSNAFDFESVVLHELGHAFGEGHNSETTDVMYPVLTNGVAKRVLNVYSDLDNIINVVTRSTSNSYCGLQKLISIHTPCIMQVIQPVTASFISDKTTGCTPLTVNFTDKSSENPTQWKWDIDNNGTIDYTSQNISHTFTTAGTYNVKLIASSATSTDTIVKIAQIVVAPALKASIEISQNISCHNGNNGSLIVTPTGGNGNYSYTWNNNHTQSTLHNINAGVYTVSLKDGYNCVATASKTISQPDPIQLNITSEAINANQFNANVQVSGGVAPYIFLLNNNIVSLLNNQIKNIVSGNYSVIVKDNNNCIQNASFSVSMPTSAIDIDKKFDALDVFPNPAANQINLHFSLLEYQNLSLELLDITGQTVFSDIYEHTKEKQSLIDVSNLPNGTYLLKFGLTEGNTFRKIIVNH